MTLSGFVTAFLPPRGPKEARMLPLFCLSGQHATFSGIA